MYTNILIAVDLSKDSEKVVEAAKKLAGGSANLNLVHVVEPVASAYSMDIYAVNVSELQQEALKMAEKHLNEFGEKCGIDSARVHTLLGSAAPEIRNLADEISADAIVIGSHGHAGWKILLGSTANKLLHGATCDVLTVHVGKE